MLHFRFLPALYRLQLLLVGTGLAWIVGMFLGLGLAVLLGLNDHGWASLMTFAALPGFVGAIAAIVVYRRLGSVTQERVLRILSLLVGFAVLVAGVVCGGLLGAAMGRVVGGATGEFVGYLTTATIGGLIGGRYGWRVASRVID
jgi:hypothetical protein